MCCLGFAFCLSDSRTGYKNQPLVIFGRGIFFTYQFDCGTGSISPHNPWLFWWWFSIKLLSFIEYLMYAKNKQMHDNDNVYIFHDIFSLIAWKRICFFFPTIVWIGSQFFFSSLKQVQSPKDSSVHPYIYSKYKEIFPGELLVRSFVKMENSRNRN